MPWLRAVVFVGGCQLAWERTHTVGECCKQLANNILGLHNQSNHLWDETEIELKFCESFNGSFFYLYRCPFHLCSLFRAPGNSQFHPSRHYTGTQRDLLHQHGIGRDLSIWKLKFINKLLTRNINESYPPGQPSSVQCFPFHPVTHKQVPFLHWPWSLHLGSQSFVLHNSPSQPSSHWHLSSTHRPWGPQLKSQSSIEQSSPLNLGSQTHFWECMSNLPCPEQVGKQGMAALSSTAQSWPVQPFLQMQLPSAQKPWLEQAGFWQSTSSQKRPLNPRAQEHFPLMQWPWLLQSGTSHSLCVNWHSLPFQPGLQWHSPLV